MRTLLLAQMAATWYMVGLIWFIQVNHYPLLGRVGNNVFADYEREHQRLTTPVVAPPMAVELIIACLLVWSRPASIPAWMCWTGLGLVLVVWASTAFLQVPRHEQLSRGFDPLAHGALVGTNWIRTIAWSVRGLLTALMVNTYFTADVAKA